MDTNVPRGSGLNGSKTVCCSCHNFATGMIRLGRPRRTRSTSSVKRVALVSFSRSLRRAPVKGPSAPCISPQAAPLENHDRPVQPTSAAKPPAQVNPKAISSNTQTTEDMSQAARPDSGGIQWWWDLDVPHIESDSESVSSTEATRPHIHDRSSLRIPPFRSHSSPRACDRDQHRWSFGGA